VSEMAVYDGLGNDIALSKINPMKILKQYV